MQTPDFLVISLNLLSGVVIFLYGLTLMSDSLKAIAGNKMQSILARFTTNIFTGILTGTLVTAVLGSSSLVIIMTIALVNAHLLTFRQSLGVVMGSNIGTTFVTQIMVFQLSEYSAILLLIGLIIVLTAQSLPRKNLGHIFLGVGLIFFGLETMDNSVLPLRNYPPFLALLQNLQNPYWGVLTGGLFTLIIQASSATVGIAITLAKQNMIDISIGISLMMGAEIGTCSDTLLASIGRSREAIRTGLFHLIFNLASVGLGLMFIMPFTQLVIWISGEAEVARMIANAHFLFNVLGVLIFASFTAQTSVLLYWLLPEKVTTTIPEVIEIKPELINPIK
ncbi:MAG: Na/Pi symporter [Microscillaceae bacterium]|nr:Na/Pi symporter [Microscillaceae bacterium]